jgi:hypothetical protein
MTEVAFVTGGRRRVGAGPASRRKAPGPFFFLMSDAASYTSGTTLPVSGAR